MRQLLRGGAAAQRAGRWPRRAVAWSPQSSAAHPLPDRPPLPGSRCGGALQQPRPAHAAEPLPAARRRRCLQPRIARSPSATPPPRRDRRRTATRLRDRRCTAAAAGPAVGQTVRGEESPLMIFPVRPFPMHPRRRRHRRWSGGEATPAQAVRLRRRRQRRHHQSRLHSFGGCWAGVGVGRRRPFRRRWRRRHRTPEGPHPHPALPRPLPRPTPRPSPHPPLPTRPPPPTPRSNFQCHGLKKFPHLVFAGTPSAPTPHPLCGREES